MEASQIPQLFGLIPTGHSPILTPTSAPSQTSLLYTIPLIPGRPFSHLVVFLLPGINLPPETAASVYLSLPPSPQTQAQEQPEFKFLGGVGVGKESAIFKINLPPTPQPPSIQMALTIGVSIESASEVYEKMASLTQSQTQNSPQALAFAGASGTVGRGNGVDTLVLAQRIIKNAFNFLASFSGNLEGGIEVVPLKAFEEWWRKFEGRVRRDPRFLERDGD